MIAIKYPIVARVLLQRFSVRQTRLYAEDLSWNDKTTTPCEKDQRDAQRQNLVVSARVRAPGRACAVPQVPF